MSHLVLHCLPMADVKVAAKEEDQSPKSVATLALFDGVARDGRFRRKRMHSNPVLLWQHYEPTI